MNTITKVEIKCSLLTVHDIEEATQCIAKTFSNGEPMTSLLNISEEEFTYFANIFIRKTAAEGLSVVARNVHTNQFVGCIICEDYVTELPEGIEKISPSFNPIIELLETLGNLYRAEHAMSPGEIYHLFMGGVYPQYAGSGVAMSMSTFIEKYAREKGYRKSIGEVTGPISQHVYIKQLGYKPLYEVKYEDFLFEDNRVFKNITACESCVLIAKDLYADPYC